MPAARVPGRALTRWNSIASRACRQLSRQLAESLHDLSTIQGNLGLFVGQAETTLPNRRA